MTAGPQTSFDSARLGQNNFGGAYAVVRHRERITLPGQAKCAPHQEIGLVKNQGGGREVGMGKSATAVTDFVADSRQRSGFDRRRFAPLGREIEQRTETAEPMDEFEVAYVPEMQSGRGRKWKIREDGENPHCAAGTFQSGLFFRGRHRAISRHRGGGQAKFRNPPSSMDER